MDMKKLYFFVFFLLLACLKDAADAELPDSTQYTLTITAGEGGSVSPEATGN